MGVCGCVWVCVSVCVCVCPLSPRGGGGGGGGGEVSSCQDYIISQCLHMVTHGGSCSPSDGEEVAEAN